MVELQAWQGVDGRAGGDQDVLRFELLLTVFGLHLYLLGFDEAAYTVVDSDLVLLHQGYAHPQLAGPDRRYVSTVPAADYHEVELISHPWLLSRLLPQ